MNKAKIIIPVFLILIVTLVSFYPSLKNSFTNWDDNLYVTENKSIRSISWGNLKHISTSFFITHYQPVTIFSYLLEYRFFKLNPFYYHLTNLILHLLNCLLVFWAIYLLTGRISIAGLTAIFFGIHPLQVETVSWISQRKTILYAFFFLGALISYLYYLRQGLNKKYYFLCLVLFILALLSKSLAFTLPLVLLLLDYLGPRKISRALLIEKIPLFILSLVFGLVALWGGYLAKVYYQESIYSLLTRLTGASSDIIFYLYKILFPVKLSAFYAYFEVQQSPLYLLYLAAVITLFAGVFISGRYTKKIIFGAGLFLLTIFPALRFLPLEEVLVADHYVYLPAIGIFYLIAEGAIWIYGRKTKYYRLTRMVLVLGLALSVVALSFLTWRRCRIWNDSLSLWGNVLENYPDTATAHNNRGEFFLGRGEYDQAITDFRLAIKIRTKGSYDPTYKYYYLNLGNALRAQGKNQEAIEIFEQLIREAEEYFRPTQVVSRPEDKNKVLAANRRAIEAGAYFNLANIKDAQGDKEQARVLYTKAIELSPRLLYAHDCLGDLYAGLGKKSEASQEFIRAIEIDQTYLPAYVKLAKIYKTYSQEEALALLYKKAIANNLDFFDAYYYTGNLLVDAQNDKKAIPLYRKAAQINPGSKEALVGLGSAYLAIGRNKEAISWLKQALQLDPELAVAHNNLAAAYYYAKEYALAVKYCDQAGKLGYAVSPKLQALLKPYRK